MQFLFVGSTVIIVSSSPINWAGVCSLEDLYGQSICIDCITLVEKQEQDWDKRTLRSRVRIPSFEQNSWTRQTKTSNDKYWAKPIHVPISQVSDNAGAPIETTASSLVCWSLWRIPSEWFGTFFNSFFAPWRNDELECWRIWCRDVSTLLSWRHGDVMLLLWRHNFLLLWRHNVVVMTSQHCCHDVTTLLSWRHNVVVMTSQRCCSDVTMLWHP